MAKAWNNNQKQIACFVCEKIFFVSPSRLAKFCSRKCNAINRSMQYVGEANHQWKGEKATYRAIHHWIEKKLGKPDECRECGITGDRGKQRNYHWANLSGKYRRDIKDWARMCVPCHKKFDLRRLSNAT